MHLGLPLLQTAENGEAGFVKEFFQFIQQCSHSNHLPAVGGHFLGWHGEGKEQFLGCL